MSELNSRVANQYTEVKPFTEKELMQAPSFEKEMWDVLHMKELAGEKLKLVREKLIKITAKYTG